MNAMRPDESRSENSPRDGRRTAAGVIAACLMLCCGALQAAPAAARQDGAAIRTSVHDFLLQQSAGIPGKVTVQVGHLDPHLKLPQCAALQNFLPTGSRAWGKTTVGVKCAAPSSWTIYVQARVNVTGSYLAAAVPLRQGQVIDEQDIMVMDGDLTALPSGILTEKSVAIGQTVTSSMAAGGALRQDMLRPPAAVRQGQNVRLISHGHGFSVSSKGQALTSAGDGQLVKAKTASGTVVSGIARSSGEVIVSF